MSEIKRLEQEYDDAQKRWQSLSKKLRVLHEQDDLEPRADEKLALEPKIAATEAERKAVEDELRRLETRRDEIRKHQLVLDARRMERHRSFAAALSTWEELRELDPDYPEVAARIEELTAKAQLASRLEDAQRRLSRRIPEIKDLFGRITRRLKEIAATGSEAEVLPHLSLVECFLGGEVSADELRQMWAELDIGPGPVVSEAPDYPALADRLERGELVLFLGSDVPSLFDEAAPDAQGLADELARRIDYHDFEGSLSMISEYYEISAEYGKSSLVRNLGPILPAGIEVPLFSTLARVKSPLVLLSTAYDTLLEQAFLDVGKRFAVVASLVSASADYEVGSLLVSYSDREDSEVLRIEQSLSELALLDAGYSLIYKVRGRVDEGADRNLRQRDALTLSEESYFTFAASKDQLIPNYVIKQFAGRGFLLLGCVPKQWEDRLVLGAILGKRRHAETPITVRKQVDRFENAYWAGRKVRRYAIQGPETPRTLGRRCAAGGRCCARAEGLLRVRGALWPAAVGGDPRPV